MNQTWREEFSSSYGVERPGIADGDADRFGVGVGQVCMKEGSSFIPSRTGVTVIVGGNNSGKSTLLREIRQELTGIGYASPGNLTQSIQSLEKIVDGTPEDMLAWIVDRTQVVHGSYGPEIQLREGAEIKPIDLMRLFPSEIFLAETIESKIVHASNGEDRFRAVYETMQFDPYMSRPNEPIQYLQDNDELLNEISQLFQKVFGRPLELDLLNYQLNLRVGKTDMETPRLNDIPPEYREAMAALPPVSTQGDGVKSFMAQVLSVITGAYPVVLLDEPEAFLHPPQARVLGEYLGNFASAQGAQVIAATHDKNFLVGLLESSADVTVVRLTRDNGCPSASQLNSMELRAVWNNPILKYSNLLEGLFHQVVILAESETDCGFFRAVLDEMNIDNDFIPKGDILFVPTNGKSSMFKLAMTLRAVSVPVVAVTDIDILNDQRVLSNLVESVGSVWTDKMKSDLNIVSSAVKDKSKNNISVDEILNTLNSIFGDRRAEEFDSDMKREFNAHLRSKDSYWKTVKANGIGAFRGEQLSAISRLVKSLAEAGVVVVQEGELER